MIMNIRGLTLIRPWPYAVLWLGKDVENRSWVPGPKQLWNGDWIALHAGQKWNQEDAMWIEDMFGVSLPHQDRHPKGVIVALLRYAGSKKSSSPWFFGPYGWTWDKLIEVEPIPHKGAQGLWTLEPEAMEKIEEILGQEAK